MLLNQKPETNGYQFYSAIRDDDFFENMSERRSIHYIKLVGYITTVYQLRFLVSRGDEFGSVYCKEPIRIINRKSITDSYFCELDRM
jgi:hypothetical protein